MKKRKLILIIVVSLLLSFFNAASVFAAPPLTIHIVVEEGVGPDPEPFIISGTAVDADVICTTGNVEDLEVSWNDPQGPFRTVWALKRFYCGDSSGTFDIEMIVQLNKTTHYTTARWHIVEGTDDYLNLKGRGSLIGIPIVPTESITDIYDGFVF